MRSRRDVLRDAKVGIIEESGNPKQGLPPQSRRSFITVSLAATGGLLVAMRTDARLADADGGADRAAHLPHSLHPDRSRTIACSSGARSRRWAKARRRRCRCWSPRSSMPTGIMVRIEMPDYGSQVRRPGRRRQRCDSIGLGQPPPDRRDGAGAARRGCGGRLESVRRRMRHHRAHGPSWRQPARGSIRIARRASRDADRSTRRAAQGFIALPADRHARLRHRQPQGRDRSAAVRHRRAAAEHEVRRDR